MPAVALPVVLAVEWFGMTELPTRLLPPIPRPLAGGLAWGALGVLLFSMSLPATRMAVLGFDPVFVAAARAAVAGLLALAVLVVQRPPWPTARQWPLLLVVAGGVVVGWPLLTTLALARVDAIHGAIVTGVLPSATAVAGVILARDRPSLPFWLAALAGLGCVLAFAVAQSGGRLGAMALEPADGLLLLAVVASAAGYAAGGVLSREMGGLRVIGSALVVCLPLSLAAVAWRWDAAGVAGADVRAWAGLGYVAVVSQYLGFFAWYRGLAQGGVARVGQVQLAQPVLSIGWAAVLLGETVTVPAMLAAAGVLLCVVMTQRAR